MGAREAPAAGGRDQPEAREANWAVQEFAAANLGDARRTVRLIDLAQRLGARPSASLPEACGDAAALKAAYRFFENAAVSDTAILASHLQATQQRVAQEPVVLAVQDTTLLDWTHHPATTGLGMLGDVTHQGLVVHSTLAITPQRVPLGLVAQQVWTRDPAQVGKKHQRHQRPTAEKESQKWLTSLQALAPLQAACPGVHLVSVGDREADLFDLFALERPAGVDLLVRAVQNRRVAEPEGVLWAAVAAVPVAGEQTVVIPRQAGQPARTAHVSVRFRAVTLHAPAARVAEHLAPVALWAVTVEEEDPPPDVEPVRWRLLTTCPVTCWAEALERVEWYACRWTIEVWHKVLKSGCRLEARQLETGDRLRRCLALYDVIAWRVLWASLLARTLPEAPCTALLDRTEWHALWCAIHHLPTPPAAPPTLSQAVRWIAQLGGYLARRHDGPPGVTVLWRGFQHLFDLSTMYAIMQPALPSRDVGKD